MTVFNPQNIMMNKSPVVFLTGSIWTYTIDGTYERISGYSKININGITYNAKSGQYSSYHGLWVEDIRFFKNGDAIGLMVKYDDIDESPYCRKYDVTTSTFNGTSYTYDEFRPPYTSPSLSELDDLIKNGTPVQWGGN